MEQIATTPFGARPVSACLIAGIERAGQPPQALQADKFGLYEDLRTAKDSFGVTDRDLTVLYALLSFHKAKTLSDNERLVVFPSNRVLAERAHGMAESTLRRHLAALVKAGLIRRQDSPNGKRYVSRDLAGEITLAFGFDLRPLLERSTDIGVLAAETRARHEALRKARLQASVMRRDVVKLLAYILETCPERLPSWVETEVLDLHRLWRRRPSDQLIEDQKTRLMNVLKTLNKCLHQSEEMDVSDDQNERHHTDSNKDSSESELSQEQEKVRPVAPPELPALPLSLVLKACPDALPYAERPPRHWHELITVAQRLCGMMGISPDAWRKACAAMGPERAATCVVAILQSIDRINSPGGYLRALTRKSLDSAFSPGPMIMALLKGQS